MEISKALGRKIPFATHLGIQLVENGNGRTVLMLEVRPELMNRFEVAHGGVVMTLLDVAMAIATHSLDPQADGVVLFDIGGVVAMAAPNRPNPITANVRLAMALPLPDQDLAFGILQFRLRPRPVGDGVGVGDGCCPAQPNRSIDAICRYPYLPRSTKRQ